MYRRSLPLSNKILRKIPENYLSLMLNDPKVQFLTNQEQFVLILDSRLDFIEHMKNKINKCIKTIYMMKKR